MTPIRLHVVAYFSRHLQTQNKGHVKDNRRVKPKYYGEALTRDEVMERMEEEEREKREKEREKREKKAQKKAGRSKKRTGHGKKAKAPVEEEPTENGRSHYIRQKPCTYIIHMCSP